MNSPQTCNEGSGQFQRLVSTRFQLREQLAAHEIMPVTFDRMLSPFYAGERWAVRRGGYVLNAQKDWEYEPLPSSRDDAFYARCRFESLEAAVAAYDEASANAGDMPHMRREEAGKQ